MCGIIGFVSEKVTKEQLELLERLMTESSIRGLHSFGVAYNQGNGLKSKKQISKMDTKELLEGVELGKPCKLIFHNRYSTSGDWHIESNNQPIVSGELVIVMNGVISMKKKSGFNKEFLVNCISENDAEIALLKYMNGASLINFLQNHGEVSYAGIILDSNLHILRNNKRPLYRFDTLDALFIVSTSDIVTRVIGGKQRLFVIEPFKELVL